MGISYRPAELEDAPFVVSTWSRTFKASSSSGMIASEDWERVMHPQIQKVLARPGTVTIVAYETADPAFLYGFLSADISERIPVVFFVYVKAPYRRSGIAKGLLAELHIDPRSRFLYTCWTSIVRKLDIPYAKFDPHIARYPKATSQEPETTWRR